jgi:D-glycero-alpha-D-manno-heptose-7-phosphate kinase
VCNIAVYPPVEVRVEVYPRQASAPQVQLETGEGSFGFDVDALPGRAPLLEAVMAEAGIPDGVALDVTVASQVPPGAATGTSAAVSVALLGALDLVAGRRRAPIEVARDAHRVEAVRLGLQSGVQDQLCSAHGGVCFIDMPEYPVATVAPVPITGDLWRELERRLLIVFLGRPHRSSEVHEQVIAGLGASGPDAAPLVGLRRVAVRSRDALMAGDLGAFGQTMIENTILQQQLHPSLVSSDAQRVIDAARGGDAVGWKVNGAGGDGGSLTLLTGPDPQLVKRVSAAVSALDRSFSVIPARIARAGLRVWESRGREGQ